MEQPPAYVSLNLEEKDIHEDMGRIITAMAGIRAEASINRDISDSLKDEYLHLTSRLASGLEAKARTDTGILERMAKIVDVMDKNEDFLHYDPKQDEHWESKQKDFIGTLDSLLIRIARDDFSTIDDKYHLVQAMKYLGVAGGTREEMIRVYDTIVPFASGILMKERRSIFNRLLGAVAGATYEITTEDGLIAIVEGNHAHLDDVLPELKRRGFTYARVTLPVSELDAFKQRYALTVVQKNDSVMEDEDKRKRVGRFMERTWPISMPIIGLLPSRISDTICNYGEPGLVDKDKEDMQLGGFLIDAAASVIGGVGLIIYGGIYYPPSMLPGIYLAGEAIVRVIYAMNTEEFVCPLHSKLPLLPIEAYMARMDKDRNGSVTLDIRLHEDEALIHPLADCRGYFESICTLDIPNSINRNLTWGRSGRLWNNSSFGKKFLSYVDKKCKPLRPKDANFTAFPDRLTDSVTYHQRIGQGAYRKDNILVCLPKERYLLTTITGSSQAEGMPKGIQAVLAAESAIDVKLEKIADMYSTRYIHIQRYADQELKEDRMGFE